MDKKKSVVRKEFDPSLLDHTQTSSATSFLDFSSVKFTNSQLNELCSALGEYTILFASLLFFLKFLSPIFRAWLENIQALPL